MAHNLYIAAVRRRAVVVVEVHPRIAEVVIAEVRPIVAARRAVLPTVVVAHPIQAAQAEVALLIREAQAEVVTLVVAAIRAVEIPVVDN